MPAETEQGNHLLEFEYTADSIATSLRKNRFIAPFAREIEGKNLSHGILITAKPRKHNPESEHNPAFILLPGILNHPREGRQFTRELLQQGKTPAVHVLHFPYDKPLDIELFLQEIVNLIDQHESVALGGLCLGASMAAEVFNRLPDEKRKKVKGMFLMSPTVSNKMWFMPKPVQRLIRSNAALRLATAGERLLQNNRTQVKDNKLTDIRARIADGFPPQCLANNKQLLSIEEHLMTIQTPNEFKTGLKAPHVSVTWVSEADEYMPPEQVREVERAISKFADHRTVSFIPHMPGRHGEVNKMGNAQQYRKEIAKWYEQVIASRL